MKNTSQTQTKLRVAKTTQPSCHTGYGEWIEEFKFGSAYIKPTPYYQHNEFNFSVYKKPTLLERVVNFLNKNL
jgi:hypothetical protein